MWMKQMRQMKPAEGTHSKIILAALVLMTALALTPARVQAATAAPSWLPGQPMLAGTQVVAMWLPVPGAVKYIIYLNDKKVMETPANQYIGVAPTEAGSYSFQVTAVDAGGAESPRSKAGIIKITVILPPEDITARQEPQSKSIYLRWERSQGGQIYNIFRAQSKEGPHDLIASQTETSYKDSGLDPGTYFYTFSAKDVGGKESKRSEAFQVDLEAFVEQASKKDDLPPLNLELKIARAKRLRTIRAIDLDYPVDRIRSVLRLTDGNIWISSSYGWFLVLDDQLKLVRAIKLAGAPGVRFVGGAADWRGMALSEDGDMIFATFADNLVAYDMTGNVLWTAKGRYPEEADDPDLYARRHPSTKFAGMEMSNMYLRDDGLLSVQLIGGPWRLLFEVDYRGAELVGWQEGYARDGQRVNGGGAQMRKAPDGNFLALEAGLKRVVKFDQETNEIDLIIGEVTAGFLGGFLGQGGGTITPGGFLLMADPALGTLQLFDLETGSYLLSLGSPKAEEDPAQPGRAIAEWSMPAFPQIVKGGKNLLLYSGGDEAFVEYELLDDLEEMAAPIADEVRMKVQEWMAGKEAGDGT